MTRLAFLAVLALFLLVGLAATWRRTDDHDHLTAAHELSPPLAALSAWSTTRSGFAFIGAVGFVASTGISALWLSVGWIVGDVLAWATVMGPLATRARQLETHTTSALAGGAEAGPRWLAGVVTAALLSLYAAAQLTAGSKAASTVLELDPLHGLLLGAGLVAAYGITGGLRAAVWTDAVQALIMVTGMIALAAGGLDHVGGTAALWARLHEIDPSLTSPWPSASWGVVPWFLGWVAMGFGVIGQPHVGARALALRDPTRARQVAAWSLGLSCAFTTCLTIVGLVARVTVPAIHADPELAVPALATMVLPDVGTGLLLGAIFAATLSTADSQVLSVAGSLHHDLNLRLPVTWLTAGSILSALTLAAFAPSEVFLLVTIAWALLASSLGPVILWRSLGGELSGTTAIWAMALGAAAAMVWRFGLGWHTAMPEAIVGLLTGLLACFSGRTRNATPRPNA
ncbi:MAG: sodium:solute symporter family transporter [Myxococcota bacterium]